MLTMPLRVTLGALLGAALLAIGAPFAHAQTDHHGGPVPGDNRTVDVHRAETPAERPCNQPKVCTFYLVGRGFDAGQQISWKIESWPPTGDRSVVKTGTLVLDENGTGRTPDMNLPNGHYKLFWNFVGENGKAKHKVFWVKCPKPSESTTPTPSESTSSSPPGSPSSSGSSPSSSTSTPPAGAPTPVQTNLPVTG